MGRVCLRDTTLPVGGGPSQIEPIFVPKGTSTLTSFFTLHRNEAVFGPDALDFVPDRWNTIHPTSYEYMAFGAGQRACLGKEKVLAEAAFVLARLAQHFKVFETRDEKPWKGQLILTAKNLNGCKLALFRDGSDGCQDVEGADDEG
jgi:cytochrome P450